MRFVSDITGEIYPTEEACLAAEKTFVEEQKKVEAEKKALAEQKKARAAEVAKAYEAVKLAEKKYYELRNAFVKDYGYFHATYTNSTEKPFEGLLELMEELFKN